MPVKDQNGGEVSSTSGSSMADQILVSNIAGISGRYSNVITTGSKSSQRSIQPEASNGAGHVAACCLESVREKHLAEGSSEKATELITASWSSGTNTIYQSAWCIWDC